MYDQKRERGPICLGTYKVTNKDCTKFSLIKEDYTKFTCLHLVSYSFLYNSMSSHTLFEMLLN